jgi:hypothetical protein
VPQAEARARRLANSRRRSAGSPRFAPAGLLIEHGGDRVMIDGAPGAEPRGRIEDWLVTDARAELIREI